MNRALTILQAVSGLGRERICEACGSEFMCGASLKGCWCSEVPLNEEVRTYLRSQYSDCLCRQCLEAKGDEQRAKGEALSGNS